MYAALKSIEDASTISLRFFQVAFLVDTIAYLFDAMDELVKKLVFYFVCVHA